MMRLEQQSMLASFVNCLQHGSCIIIWLNQQERRARVPSLHSEIRSCHAHLQGQKFPGLKPMHIMLMHPTMATKPSGHTLHPPIPFMTVVRIFKSLLAAPSKMCSSAQLKLHPLLLRHLTHQNHTRPLQRRAPRT